MTKILAIVFVLLAAACSAAPAAQPATQDQVQPTAHVVYVTPEAVAPVTRPAAVPPAGTAALIISSPANGARVGTSPVTVAGTAPGGARVVQDISFAADNETVANAGGAWSMAVELDEGDNALTFRIGDNEATAKNLLVWLSADDVAPPVGDGSGQYAGFIAHILSSTSEFGDHASSIGEYATALDVASLRLAISRALDFTEGELEWLDDNAPVACYTEVHGAWRRAVEKYTDSFSAIDLGLTPPITTSDVERGSRLMSDANELIGEATEAMDSTSC